MYSKYNRQGQDKTEVFGAQSIARKTFSCSGQIYVAEQFASALEKHFVASSRVRAAGCAAGCAGAVLLVFPRADSIRQAPLDTECPRAKPARYSRSHQQPGPNYVLTRELR